MGWPSGYSNLKWRSTMLNKSWWWSTAEPLIGLLFNLVGFDELRLVTRTCSSLMTSISHCVSETVGNCTLIEHVSALKKTEIGWIKTRAFMQGNFHTYPIASQTYIIIPREVNWFHEKIICIILNICKLIHNARQCYIITLLNNSFHDVVV